MPDNKGKDIDKAKKKAVDGLKSHIEGMGDVAYEIMLQQIENTFDIKGGKIQPSKEFVKQLNKLTVEVLDLLQHEPKFNGPVSQFVKRMPAIENAIVDFQKEVNGIKVPDFNIAKKIATDEIIDQMLNNGLNRDFVVPLRDLVFENVSQGLSLKDARLKIKEFIKGGNDVSGKLGRYLEQTAEQAVTAYSGIIGNKLMDTFNYDGMLIVGSLIDNSSPQCRYAINTLKGTIKRTDWPKLEGIAKDNGLVKGTTFNDLPLNLLHWGCKHDFYPIILNKAS